MKKSCLISCPIDTYSGYGARSRDLVKSIIKAKGDVWDIKILSQKWGSLPFGFLDDHNEIDLATRVTKTVEGNPDIWIQISIPNEFQRVGKKFNIGITAGIETTLCDKTWIEGIDRMDEVWVSSTHAKDVFNKHPEAKPSKPIKVLFEGLDTIKYFESDLPNIFNLSAIKEEFAFLYVGHWIGRKNVEGLVRSFFEAFKSREDQPALILKTQIQSSSIADRTRVQKAIKALRDEFEGYSLPNVYLLQGELSNWDMNELYNHSKVKVMVSNTRGEGFGRPLLEFSAMGKPIIATNWSGHRDFLNPKYTHLIPGKLVNVPSKDVNSWVVEGSQWFESNPENLQAKFVELYDKYDNNLPKAKRQQQYVLKKFTVEHMDELVKKYTDEVEKSTPQQVQVKLPQL